MKIRHVPMYLSEPASSPVRTGVCSCAGQSRSGRFPGLTGRVEHWAAVAPDRVFLARRVGRSWRSVSTPRL